MAMAGCIADDEAERQRCLREQATELALLNSMYNVPEELQFATVDGYSQLPLDELLQCGNDHSTVIDPRSNIDEFSLKLKELAGDVPLELTFRFPPHYPRVEPLSVLVRCSALDGRSSCLINTALRQHLSEQFEPGEPQVMNAVGWIQEHFHEYRSKKPSQATGAKSAETQREFERIWLHSHHIYSKFKRKNIVTVAGQLNLSGFSMPGKPGVVCVEGDKEDCRLFWDTLRTWTWKKIVVKHRETTDLRDIGKDEASIRSAIKALRKFGPLKEVAFDVRHGGGREFHMDMAGFNKYLIDHECGYMFPMLFGLEGTGAD